MGARIVRSGIQRDSGSNWGCKGRWGYFQSNIWFGWERERSRHVLRDPNCCNSTPGVPANMHLQQVLLLQDSHGYGRVQCWLRIGIVTVPTSNLSLRIQFNYNIFLTISEETHININFDLSFFNQNSIESNKLYSLTKLLASSQFLKTLSSN